MATVTKPIALDESFNTTELTPRNIADVLAQELSRITGRNASQVEYDNTESGLTADNVQEALDEIVEDIPTVPSVDIQTAVDEFSTYNGGLLSECKVALSPNQDLHGYDSPWVGGAGKNKVPFFTSSTVSGRVWTVSDDGIITITGTSTGNSYKVMNITLPAGTYQLSGGDPNGTSGTGDEYVQVDGTVVARSYGNTNQTFTLSEEKTVTLALRDFQTAGNSDTHVFKPMICLTSAVNPLTYEPYENICPISGHTQVEVDVSDGQTTQEQVTVNLGGTYYSGMLDVVSGVFVPDTAEKTLNGSEGLPWQFTNNTAYQSAYVNATSVLPNVQVKSGQPYISNVRYNYFKNIIYASDRAIGCAYIDNGWLNLIFEPNKFATSADLNTFLSNNPLQINYPVATPTPIQLTPQQVKALVGENHLSAPLDGQEITESKYKQTFTFDDVIAYIQSLS